MERTREYQRKTGRREKDPKEQHEVTQQKNRLGNRLSLCQLHYFGNLTFTFFKCLITNVPVDMIFL